MRANDSCLTWTSLATNSTADRIQDNSSGIQVSTWCGSAIPAVVLWVDVNVHWPSSPAFFTDETAGHSKNEDEIRRRRTSYLEQSARWAARSRHFTDCVQKQTENLSVRHHVTASAHLQHHFLVALRLANLRYINIFNNNNQIVLIEFNRLII